MKKTIMLFVSALLLSCLHVPCFASIPDDTDEQGEDISIELDVTIDTTTSTGSNPKTPVFIPQIHQNGHTLYLNRGCDDSTIILIDENGVEVFSSYIMDGYSLVNIPEWLVGTYEIHIHRGNYCFYGQIVL